VTACGLAPPLSEIATRALEFPVAAGEKVMLKLQLAEAATLAPHVLVAMAKFAAFVPLIAMLVIESAVVPTLVNVTDRAALVVPTVWEPKARLLVDRLTTVA
jgi:hypothetical protein